MIGFTGPNAALQIFGVPLVGVTPENGEKLLLTIGFVAAVVVLGRLIRRVAGAVARTTKSSRGAFWVRQGAQIFTAVMTIIVVASIWFDDPSRLTTAFGLVLAGLAFAMQRVVTALAGYFVILRGGTFDVGDRIVMGGVRGDVVALGIMQTTVMEMGQPGAVAQADPAMWVRARQYTGRLVTISNAKIFDEPVYNYTRDFPFIYEEIAVPVHYDARRHDAERILLEVARAHAPSADAFDSAQTAEFARRYGVSPGDIGPRVYWRATDNWLELSVRFLSWTHRVRDLKDAMTRELLSRFDEAGISIASATFEIVAAPPLKLERLKPKTGDDHGA